MVLVNEMHLEFGRDNWRTFEQGIQREWLLTNGIGGFASSTIIGANTRRYHGLLIAALRPPVERHLILSKVDESVITGGRSYDLYSSRTPDFTAKGYIYLQRAMFDSVPTFIYSVGDMFIEKKICMVYGENTVCLVYHVLNGAHRAIIRLTPLINFRDYHHTSSKKHLGFYTEVRKDCIVVKPEYFNKEIKVYCSAGVFTKLEDCYFLNMYYPVERERGLDFTEDHFIPGYFDVAVDPGEETQITLIATVEDEIKNKEGPMLIEQEEERKAKLVEMSGLRDDFACRLVRAADDFIVYRQSTNSRTIIAGYPWFTDWGRDALISLPGLTLVTGRYEDAKAILLTFSKYVKDGLIPNVFPDYGTDPSYNSVDATLWYFEAVWKYLKYTDDFSFIYENVYDVLINSIESMIRGTMYDIKADRDGLLSAGNENTQLTWMDAKVGGFVVTPRHGKAVEINALWYNALMIVSELAGKKGGDASSYTLLAEKVRETFLSKFWNENEQCLYDVISSSKDNRMRPNQILAVSLSHPVVEGEKAKKIVDRVFESLYTDMGLRTLSRDSEEYRGIYTGDQYSRDTAYHQGTVWPWIFGHFISAFMKVYGNDSYSKRKVKMLLKPFEDHLRDGCIGSISEIFDGDEPYMPRGCFAQAWSVAEILRAYVENVLGVSG